MEKTSSVSKDVSHVNQPASTSTQGEISSTAATQQDQAPPVIAQTSSDGMSLVREETPTEKHFKMNLRYPLGIMEDWDHQTVPSVSGEVDQLFNSKKWQSHSSTFSQRYCVFVFL